MLVKSAGHLEAIVKEALHRGGMCVWLISPPTETNIANFQGDQVKLHLCLVTGGDVYWESSKRGGDGGTEALKITYSSAFDQRLNIKQSL